MSHGTSRPVGEGSIWILFLLIALTLVFGYLGHQQLERETRKPRTVDKAGAETPALEHTAADDGWSSIYYSAQLLVGHGHHLESRVNGWLQIARYTGILFLFWAGIIAFLVLCHDKWMLLWLEMHTLIASCRDRVNAFWQDYVRPVQLLKPRWFWRRHVVICGLGDLGLRLALDARNRKLSQRRFVVAIEKAAESAAIAQARKSGVYVIEGDACDPAILRKSRIAYADFVVAACPKDATNIAIAATIGQVMPPSLRRSEPLVCRLLLSDEQLHASLSSRQFFRSSYRVDFATCDRCQVSARLCLHEHKLDFETISQQQDLQVRLVVVGFGQMGRNLANYAARIGHFANEVTKNRRLQITVVDESPEGALAFESSATLLKQVSDVDFKKPDSATTQSDFVEYLNALNTNLGTQSGLITYAICLEQDGTADDQGNFAIATTLDGITKGGVQILIYQSSRRGLAALFASGSRGPGIGPRLHAFGMSEEIFTWDLLLRDTQDQLARVLHEQYLEAHPGAYPPWEWLDDHLKNSNREAADHIYVKLRALGLHTRRLDETRDRNDQITEFTEGQRDLLAKMEHLRWCAEKTLSGWRRGPKNAVEKTHPDLDVWANLNEATRKNDFDQVDAIPAALARIGEAIYR
jgi:hypothetical protein